MALLAMSAAVGWTVSTGKVMVMLLFSGVYFWYSTPAIDSIVLEARIEGVLWYLSDR